MIHENSGMKNITISLSEDVARWARVWAAEHETSVSRIVGGLLRERMDDERSYDGNMRAFLNRKPRMLKDSQATYPNRDSLHERHALR